MDKTEAVYNTENWSKPEEKVISHLETESQLQLNQRIETDNSARMSNEDEVNPSNEEISSIARGAEGDGKEEEGKENQDVETVHSIVSSSPFMSKTVEGLSNEKEKEEEEEGNNNGESEVEEENQEDNQEEEEEVSDEAIVREVMQRKQRERENNLQFKTKSRRELESLQNKKMYKRTTIKVYFPDHTVLQACFAPREKIQDVMNVIQSSLKEPYCNLPFHLFSTPPKKMYLLLTLSNSRLSPNMVLTSERLVPTALLYLEWKVHLDISYKLVGVFAQGKLYGVFHGGCAEQPAFCQTSRSGNAN